MAKVKKSTAAWRMRFSGSTARGDQTKETLLVMNPSKQLLPLSIHQKNEGTINGKPALPVCEAALQGLGQRRPREERSEKKERGSH